MKDFMEKQIKRTILSETTFSMQIKALADSVTEESNMKLVTLQTENVIKKPIFSINIGINEINFNFDKQTLDIIGYLTYKL